MAATQDDLCPRQAPKPFPPIQNPDIQQQSKFPGRHIWGISFNQLAPTVYHISEPGSGRLPLNPWVIQERAWMVSDPNPWHHQFGLRSCDKIKLYDTFFFILFSFTSTKRMDSKCDLLSLFL
jgi:hypothetical protein